MGVHVVGEIRAEIDTGLDGESTIVIRCDPERTTNDLGVRSASRRVAEM